MSQRMNRRRFIQTTAASGMGALMPGSLPAQAGAENQTAGSSGIPAPGRLAGKCWIDPSIAAWPPGPWRKVHIEYHSSRHIPRLGERFNADEFGDRLVAAHVNGATV